MFVLNNTLYTFHDNYSFAQFTLKKYLMNSMVKLDVVFIQQVTLL